MFHQAIKWGLFSLLCCFVLLVFFSNMDVGALPVQYDTSPVYRLEWSPDGTKIALSGGEQPCDPTDLDKFAVRIVDPSTGQVIQNLIGHSCPTDDVDWSPDGLSLISVSQFEPSVKIWDIATGNAVHTYTDYTYGNSRIQWNPVSNMIAGAYFTNSITLWNVNGGPENRVEVYLYGTVIDWRPSGDQLTVADASSGLIEIYDFDTQQIEWSLQGDKRGIRAVNWSLDGQYLATGGGDHTIRVWDLETGQIAYTLIGHTHAVSNVKWRPNTNQIASSGDDGTIRIWDTLSHRQIELFKVSERVNDLDWSPDGTQLAYTGYEATLEIIMPASKPDLTSTSVPTSTRLLIVTPTTRH